MTSTGAQVPTDPIATAEALDELLAMVGDESGLAVLQEDARQMLHGVIVALETAQRERDQARSGMGNAIGGWAQGAEHLEGDRDEARRVARAFLSPLGRVTVHKALADSLGLDSLPDWLTSKEQPSDV